MNTSRVDQIAAEIAALRAERRELLRLPKRDRNEAIYRLFDGGASCPEIARQLDMTQNNVRWILWQAGRTKAGRRKTRARIAEATSQGASA